jgi:DnaJ-class molecular chaperone
LNQVRDAKAPELSLLPSFHELVEDLRARLSAPEPEPVACAACSGRGWYTCGASDMRLKCPECKGKKTAPPQREWQGLTDEEISELIRNTHNTGSFVRAIEAKLKEKNNG